MQRLTTAVTQAQAQMGAYQKQLEDLQQQLALLLLQMNAEKSGGAIPSATPQATVANGGIAAAAPAASVEDIRERQAVQESQIATSTNQGRD